MLVVIVAALFLVTASWPIPTWAAGGTSTETQMKSAKKHAVRTANRAVKTSKSKSMQTQTANAARNVASVPGTACVPCWSGPAYTWNVPATAAASSQPNTRVTSQPQWPSTTNGAARQGAAQVNQAQPAGGGSPGPTWYNVWIPCWNVPTNSWSGPATAGPGWGQGYTQPIQPLAPPSAAAYPAPMPAPLPPPALAASTGGKVCAPLQRLFSALKPPC